MGNPMHPKTIRLNSAPRCNARTRRGTVCQCPSMQNGRCRMHGGKSTGRPKTHGRYIAEVIIHRQVIGDLLKQSREMVQDISGH